MPRKTQFAADEIVAAAYDIVKENGWEGLSVTAVAKKIGSSTMPIYSYFENFKKLKDAVVIKGWEILMEYETRQYTGDIWIDHSMGYIAFAMAEKNIFHSMFDGRNIELQRKMSLKHWNFLVEFLKDYEGFKGLEKQQIFLIRYSRALFTHGVAVSVISNWGKLLQVEGMIENFVVAGSHSILEGYKQTYDLENKNIAFLDKEIKEAIERMKKLENKGGDSKNTKSGNYSIS